MFSCIREQFRRRRLYMWNTVKSMRPECEATVVAFLKNKKRKKLLLSIKSRLFLLASSLKRSISVRMSVLVSACRIQTYCLSTGGIRVERQCVRQGEGERESETGGLDP